MSALDERAIAARGWPGWARGMLTTTGYRLVGYDNGGWQCGHSSAPERPFDLDRLQDQAPDLTDRATLGIIVIHLLEQDALGHFFASDWGGERLDERFIGDVVAALEAMP